MEFSLKDDNYRTKGLRQRLIKELETKNIASKQVLNAMLAIPRHLFFSDPIFVEKAYENMAFQIGAGQTISHPSTVAFQTTLLDLQKKEKVLEIGTGSGYQTAILVCLGAKVYSIERQHSLFVKTKQIFNQYQITADLNYGDGFLGKPIYAPYDKMIITCGASTLPISLLAQLKVGGIMIVPIGNEKIQIMHKIIKTSENEWTEEQFGSFSFVPMLEDKV